MARPTKVTLNNLKLREKKAWRVIDQYLAERKDGKISASTRLDAAVFILKRIYPEKIDLNLEGKIDHFFNLAESELNNIEAGIFKRTQNQFNPSTN